MTFLIDGPHDEAILLRWTAALGVRIPRCDDLMRRWGNSYREVLVAPDEVGAVRDELDVLRAAVEQRRGDELILERRIRARDPAVRAAAVEPLLAADADVARLRALVAICDAALRDREALLWGGD